MDLAGDSSVLEDDARRLPDTDVALASRCTLPVSAEVVLARSREEGFRHALKPSATVLVGARRRPWRTAEEKLARALVRDGRQVVLMHVE